MTLKAQYEQCYIQDTHLPHSWWAFGFGTWHLVNCYGVEEHKHQYRVFHLSPNYFTTVLFECRACYHRIAISRRDIVGLLMRGHRYHDSMSISDRVLYNLKE